MSDIRLAIHVDACYRECYRGLYRIAQKFWSLGDPRNLVEDWEGEAALIAIRFDLGELVKRVYIKPQDGPAEMVDFDPTIHTEEQILSSFNMYLKRCFANHLIKKIVVDIREKKNAREIRAAVRPSVSSFHSNTDENDNSASLDNVLAMIKLDIEKIQDTKANVAEATALAFLRSLYIATLNIRQEYGNFIVIPDINMSDNHGYINIDYYELLESRVKHEMAQMILAEENPILVKQYARVIMGENEYGLSKRLSRYFHKHRGGIRHRIHKFI